MKKKIVSFTCALAMAVSMAGAVSAADYGYSPNYQLPEAALTGGSMPASVQVPALSGVITVTTSSINAAVVETAIAQGQPIQMSADKIKLSKSAIADLASYEDATITITTNKLDISINSDSITNAAAINLSMNLKNTGSSSVISTEAAGELGCTADVVVTTCKMSKKVLEKAHVYYIAEDGTVEDLGKVKLTKDSKPIVSMSKGGKYVISVNSPNA